MEPKFLYREYLTWVGTCRQDKIRFGIVHYMDESNKVVAWAWAFSDPANLISRDVDQVEARLESLGYTLYSEE